MLPADLVEADFACPSTLAALVSVAHERIQPLREGFLRLAALIAIETNELNALALRSKAALESAPFLIGSQHLIHSVCGSWNNESRYAMATLRIHAADLGVGQPGASRICRYQELLRQHSLADAGEDLLHTGDDLRISDGAFNFAAPLVVLGHFPESLTGEILGVNLYLRQCGLLPPLEFVANDDWPAMQYLDLGRDPSGNSTDLLELAQIAVREFLGDAAEVKYTAVRQGYHWARRQTEAMSQAMLAVLERWVDPREAAQHLVSRRRLDACQYHEKIRLNGVPMQSLLKDDGALPFLDHLAASAYVRAGKPELSLLLTSLISPRGKMFRIFNRDDITVLHRWILGLPYADAPLHPAAHHMWKDDDAFAGAAGSIEDGVEAQTLVPSIGARQAYPRLLHEELTPAEEIYARQYVVRWLARAARNVAKGNCPLPEEWVPGVLRQWLQCQHEASNKAIEQEDDLPSREGVVADVLSLAPLTMIDGAWLAGFAHPAVACSGYGCRLFETFFDELGNGIETQNHPAIYRNLLRALHGDLPATVDSGYANASCFSDKDFELPVFWLAIGRYPLTYCAEILGLNLAMELSGVGGGYRRTHKALVAYGYPTMFVDLHNSIDNISSGHTAWAAASLDAYLSTFPRSDSAAVWVRVRNGFAALNLPKGQTMLDKIREKVESLL
ncbi:iron-containing redox enzyme family protein [Thiomonas arsenitoxydans]|uniref:iron-containing redox enzyme family protein n=1 Tax=Thiomonas arsenitoxydans (strain DSM 22701 / CIP 110005 / 3As) TaxID=426114 RepID=UPI0018E0B480|nr:iron-containing redox enzyme family protein [Thiomonas arsenitoxydans]